MRRSLAVAGVLAALVVAAPWREAPAQPAPAGAQPSAEDRKAAGEKFGEGERAFKAGDFATAATAFEAAYRLAPHPSALWNAARARRRAGEPARAANLYARYLREAPAEAPDRPQATQALTELAAGLGRVEVSAGGDVTQVTVGGERADGSAVYVVPGRHLVHGVVAGRAITRETPLVAAGATVSVALVAEPAVAAAPTSAASAAPTAATAATAGAPKGDEAPAPKRGRKGWHPAVPIVSGSVSLLLGAATVWSGLDTLEQKKTFDELMANKSYDAARLALEDGKKRQARTNLVGAFAVSGALFTLVAAVALVEWNDPDATEAKPSASIGFGPGSASLRGRF